MKTVPLLLLCLLLGCSRSSRSAGPSSLQPPVGTGMTVVAIEGTWKVSAIEVETMIPLPDNDELPAREPSGLAPPALGDLISFDSGGFLLGAGRPLRREPCEASGLTVASYLNQVDGRFALFDLDCHTPVVPGLADGGGTRLQMAFGSTAQGTLLGKLQFDLYAAPIAANTPRHGLFTVHLTRVQ